MTTQIFYFSGTGNSLALAKKLAEKLENTEVISIPSALKNNIKPNAEAIGIVYPVYATGMPIIIEKFLETLKDSRDAYLFAVSNYALLAGNSLLLLNKLLRKNEIELSSGFIIKMPHNFIPLFNATPLEKQKQRFAAAEKKIDKIAEIIKARKTNKLERHFFPPTLLSQLIYNQCKKALVCNANNFRVDEKCNSCGLCAKVCQFGNIKIENGKPVWGDYCEQCMACLQWCPKEAIQFRSISKKRRRYHHPDIKAEELFMDNN
jgi:ferredoxin